MPAIEVIEERITFAAGNRMIEGVLAYRDSLNPLWACLLAGPHPMLGGEMDNNVQRKLADHAIAAGAAVLSFNYAGVGESEGGPVDWPVAISDFWRQARIPEESQWCEDTGAALSELTRFTAGLPCAAIGYSFGCWAMTRAVTSHPVRALVLVSPNPLRHDFSLLQESEAPILVTHSDQEIECSKAQIDEWYGHLREPKCIHCMTGAEHFFRRRETEVAEAVLAFLTRQHFPIARAIENGH